MKKKKIGLYRHYYIERTRPNEIRYSDCSSNVEEFLSHPVEDCTGRQVGQCEFQIRYIYLKTDILCEAEIINVVNVVNKGESHE